MTRKPQNNTYDELLDIVDVDDKVIGTASYGEIHKDASKFHREVCVAVFNSKGEVLLQQRSFNKVNDPGVWKITAAGHADAGEDPKAAVIRETKEELGLNIDPVFYIKEFKQRINEPGYEESRFVYVYYAIIKGKPNMKLDKNEVENAKWVRPEMLDNFAKKNDWDLNGFSNKMIMEIYKKKIV